jgi:hypothetical protein
VNPGAHIPVQSPRTPPHRTRTILVENDNQAEHTTVGGDKSSSPPAPSRRGRMVSSSTTNPCRHPLLGVAFWTVAVVSTLARTAIRTVMQDDGILPDDVPVADAVEQQRPATDPLPDEAVEPPGDPPLEASASDWLGQQETVDLDPEEDR